ncbi:MAG: hypothetical protein Q4A74_06365 [Cardiobacteriaceae bacterium]|nr:hypothetical protein [Cardiobacteriaceae bacterium]
MTRRIFLASFFFVFSLIGHTAVYRGGMGASEIILDDEEWSYFDSQEQIPYVLLPMTTDCPLTQHCFRTDNGDILKLQKTERGYHGIWKTAKQQEISLDLRAFVAPETDPLNRLYAQEMPYQMALLANTAFEPLEKSIFMGRTLQWYREPHSGLSHFIIEAGYPEAAKESINRFLRAQALGTLMAYKQCIAASSASVRDNIHYKAKPEPSYMNDHFISYWVHEQSNCGTAYPYEGYYGVNYSVADGRGLELEDILWIGTEKPHWLDSENESDEDIRVQRAAWLLFSLKREVPQALESFKYREEYYLYPYFYLTPQGVYIGPLLPRTAAIYAHPEGAILPYLLFHKYPGRLGEIPLP